MKHVEWVFLVFRNDEFKPVDQRIVYAFVCAEARNAHSAGGEDSFFGSGQVRAGTKDAYRVSCRSEQARESFRRDCQSADVRCILFTEEINFHGRKIRGT